MIILIAIIVLLIFIFYFSINQYESRILRMKSEPHTMRNMFEELRVKIKRLNKKAEKMRQDPSLVDEVIGQVDKLYGQINRDSDFLAYVAETDEFRQEVVPMSIELEFVNKLIERYGIDNAHYKIENKLNDDKIGIPSMITQSMIENAFKYGDTTSSDFLTVTFEGPDNDSKYTIQVKNKVIDSFDSEVYSTKQGIKNLVERIAYYNDTNEYNYTATPKKAFKNGYYIFRIEFTHKS